MALQEVVKNVAAKMGYRVMREATYQSFVADEAKEIARGEAQRLGAEAAEDGSLLEEEYNFLRELVEEANAFPGPIIEIGTLFGRTTCKIALWKQPLKKIVTVDNYCWNPLRLPADIHFQVTSLVLQYLKDTGHVIQVRGDKDQWFGGYHGEAPALVFCDADHSYEATARDIDFALNAGAKIVCGHDYCAEHSGTMRAVDERGGPKRLKGTVWALAGSSAT
jgi:hypothetical protein